MDFEGVIKKFSPMVRRIAYKLSNRYRFFNYDDFYQEAILYLWCVFRQDKLADKTDSYILQGCYYYLKNHIRTSIDKASISSLNEILEGGDNSLEELISDTAAKNIIEDIDEVLIKEYAHEHLDSREKKIFDLSYEGFTVREIGKRLKISHVMVVKIRRRLKARVTGFKDDKGYQN